MNSTGYTIGRVDFTKRSAEIVLSNRYPAVSRTQVYSRVVMP